LKRKANKIGGIPPSAQLFEPKTGLTCQNVTSKPSKSAEKVFLLGPLENLAAFSGYPGYLGILGTDTGRIWVSIFALGRVLDTAFEYPGNLGFSP